MSLSKDNFVEVDKMDPRRLIVQGEDVFPYTTSKIFSMHTITKDCPDLKKFDEALEKMYEWYPVLRLHAEYFPDNRYYYREGLLRPINFAEDVKNNEVIRSTDDYQRILSDIYSETHISKYVFGPRMFKVDIPVGSNDPYLSDRLSHVIVFPADHLITDGKSHRIFRDFFNGYFKDKNYKPKIPVPQTCVNNPHVLIPPNIEPKPIKSLKIGKYQTFGWEKNSKIDKLKRGISISIKHVKKSELKHPSFCSLTSTLTAIHLFIYASLLLDYHKHLSTVGSTILCPYTMDYTGFQKLMEGDHKFMCGNDIGTVRTYQTIDRESPRTLYQIIEQTKEHHKETRKDITQSIVNCRYGPFLPYNIPPGSERLNNIVTNVGTNKMEPGPLETTSGYTFVTHHIGCICLTFTGENDGSTDIAALGHKTSFTNEFLHNYADMVLHISQICAKRDMTREELISLPEYKKLVEFLRQ